LSWNCVSFRAPMIGMTGTGRCEATRAPPALHAAAGFVEHSLDGGAAFASLSLRHEVFQHVAIHAPLLGCPVTVIFPGPYAARQRRPRRHSVIQRLGPRISSRSTVRSIRLYSICSPTKGDRPRNWASVFA
jgi:hypothetical protein